MTRAFLLAAVLALANAAGAQAPERATEELRAEMVFWESVRSSSDPADFRAYLEQYPNGKFAALARNRLAALSPKREVSAPAASPPPAEAGRASAGGPAVPLAGAGRLPSEGDAWTYRLTERTNPIRQRKYEVKVTAASATSIAERYQIENGRSGNSKHTGGAYLVGMGVSVFSPYLDAFQNLAAQPALGIVQVDIPACTGLMACRATAEVVGEQKIVVPAGTFDTIHVRIDHEWGQRSSWPGRRQLDVWYAPSVKRAVKFSSRQTGAPLFDANFDLELTGYQIK